MKEAHSPDTVLEHLGERYKVNTYSYLFHTYWLLMLSQDRVVTESKERVDKYYEVVPNSVRFMDEK